MMEREDERFLTHVLTVLAMAAIALGVILLIQEINR